MVEVYLRERILIAKDSGLMARSEVKKRYVLQIYNEQACQKCHWLSERHCGECEVCPEYKGTATFNKTVTSKQGREFHSLPMSDLAWIRDVLVSKGRDVSIVNQTKQFIYPMKRKIKFTGQLYGPNAIDADGNPRADQKKLVKEWLEDKRGVIVAAPRSGKCLTGSAIVNTDKGFLQLNELVTKKGYKEQGNRVATPFGIRQSTHTFRDVGKTIKITTHNGFEIEGTPEHPLLILTNNLRHVWRRLDKIEEGDHIVSQGKLTPCIWPTKSFVSPEQAVIMGMLLANGSRSKLHSNDPSVQKRFIRTVKKATGEYPTKTVNKGLTSLALPKRYYCDVLMPLGYDFKKSSDKNIPVSIRSSTKDVMTNFLEAYFSCDSGANGNSIELVTASKKLAHQLHIILFQGYSILGALRSKLSSASNSNSPTVREYYSVFLAGSQAYAFVKAFPKAKVSVKFGGRWSSPEIKHQEFQNDYVPCIKESARSAFHSALVNPDTPDRRVRLAEGSVGNVKQPFDMRIRGKDSIGHLSRKAFQDIDWMEAAKETEKLSPELASGFLRIAKRSYHYERVVAIQKNKTKKTVYDLTVPAGHAFYANTLASHNTTMAVYLTCELGVQTVIIAHQFELLDQFMTEFNERTNHLELAREGRPCVELVKNLTALKKSKAEVILINPQKFYARRDQVAKLLRRRSFMVVDEAHQSMAAAYAEIIGKVEALWALALSATDKRKDGRDKMMPLLIGPVVAVSESVSLKPSIKVYEVKAEAKLDYKRWSSAIGWLSDSKKRNQEIVGNVFKDLADGHTSIIVPVSYKRHMTALTEMINKRAMEDIGVSDLAVMLHSKAERKEVLARADNATRKRPCVLVAIMSIIKQGITLKAPTSLHAVIPMSGSHVGAPMARQCFYRVSTPVAGKRQPKVTLYIDRSQTFFRGAIRTLYYKELLPRSSGDKALYLISPETRSAISNAVKSSSREGAVKRTNGKFSNRRDTPHLTLWET